MLLEADTLIYDNDNDTVTAAGGVQIDYGGNRLVAQRVIYDRKTGRLVASGNVEIVDSERHQGLFRRDRHHRRFRQRLRQCAARRDRRQDLFRGRKRRARAAACSTTFNNGVYTACEPCEDKPDKAPIWRIKAQKIIWNGKAKTVRFENSRFEFFGMPIAYFPAFEIADPTVKRKSGFLIPGISYKSDLGVGVSVPYYFALSPTYDLTLTGSATTEAGLPRRGRVAPALQQRRIQPQGRRHQPAEPGGIRRSARVDSRHRRRPEQIARHDRHARAGSTSIRAGLSAGTCSVQSDKNFSNTYDIERLSTTSCTARRST